MFIGRRPVAAARGRGFNERMGDASNPSPEPQIIALVRDLMFSSRIRATAKDLGVDVRLLRDPQQLHGNGGRKLLVDLNQEGAIDAARQWKDATSGVVVGFVSHVDVETINRARAAGIDQVMARSRFVDQLPSLLTEGQRNTDPQELIRNQRAGATDPPTAR
jgi:hypothetical protein